MKKVILLLLVILAVGLTSCSTKIDASSEGVLVNQYGDDKGTPVAVAVKGRVWYNPWTQDVYEYETFVQQVDYDAFTVNAQDGSIFTIDPMLNYRITAGKGAEIFLKYRKDLSELNETVLRTAVKDAFKNVFGLYKTDSLISNRNRIDRQVQDSLSKFLAKENFLVEQLTYGLRYPESITRAIDEKNKAVQKSQQAENDLRTAEMVARKKLIEARAEAEANRLKQTTLTALLIQKAFIDKWDGHAPLYGSAPVNFKNVQ